jgi:hypothetical protein
MFHVTEKIVYGMASVRVLSSLIEMTGAILMLYFGTAAKALQVNATLALVGPIVLVSVTFLGVLGVAGEISWGKIVWIVLGVGCILYGAKG